MAAPGVEAGAKRLRPKFLMRLRQSPSQKRRVFLHLHLGDVKGRVF
jgi:hypothetical protein